MNEIEAREIGTAFLKEKGLDVNAYGEVDKLGEARDCTIFFLFPIVGEDGDGYLGGRILALDKRTRFSLLIPGSPNFFDYYIWLFRTIILNQLYDFKLSLADYGKKKETIKTDIYSFDPFTSKILSRRNKCIF